MRMTEKKLLFRILNNDKTALSTLILICRQVSDAAWYCWSLKRAMAANQVWFALEEDGFIGSGLLYDEMMIMI